MLDAREFIAGDMPYAMVAGEFDGDGVIDLAVSPIYERTVEIFHGDGEGGFTQVSRTSLSAFPLDLVAADFDGDGATDVAAAAGESVKVLMGDGSGSFGSVQTVSMPASVSATGVFTADLTGDGREDLGVVGAVNQVVVFPGSGRGRFGSPISTITGIWSRAAVAGQFDEGAALDVVTANEGGSNITLLTGLGGGSFSQPKEFPGAAPIEMVVEEMDGDGHLDLVAAFQGVAIVAWGDGTGSFGDPQIVAGIEDGHASDLSVADFDGDGIRDVALGLEEGEFQVVRGLGGRGFDLTGIRRFHTGASVATIGPGDLNRDGRVDLVLGLPGPSGAGSVGIALGSASEGFVLPSSTESSGGDLPSDMVVVDLNLDDALDVVVANAGTAYRGEADGSQGTIAVLFGDGRGGLSEPQVVATGASPLSVSTADLDGDGAPEIVVPFSGVVYDPAGEGMLEITGTPRGVVILQNDGFGSFTALPLAGSGSAPTDAILLDLNLDGVKDIAVSDILGHQAGVYLGGGTGQFFGPANFLTNLGPYRIVAGDFDEDGRADLATANAYAASISVLLSRASTARMEGERALAAGEKEEPFDILSSLSRLFSAARAFFVERGSS